MRITTKSLTGESTDYTGLVKMLGKKRPRKQVQFFEQEEIVRNRESFEGEVKNSWYQRTELASFKLEARDYILGATTKGAQVETRGFERYSVERAQNKQITKHCTLLAYKKGMSEDEISSVARACSSWAQNEAFKLACKDFCEVYHPELIGLISEMPAVPLEKPNKKRTFQVSPEEGRRVRLRIC
jgi:hypothetical protein